MSLAANAKFDVAIVGAGFAGIACAIALIRRNPAFNIVLLDPAAKLPAGLPFAGARPEHLLNVRADQMTLDNARPLNFCDYLAGKTGETSAAFREVFAQRALYCDYLRTNLSQAQRDAAAATGQIKHIAIQVNQIARSSAGYLISGSQTGVGDIAQVSAPHLVLALGAGQNKAPMAHPRWHAGPWYLTDLPAHSDSDAALIIGTGLTGVDSAQTLHRLGWRGAIRMLSPNARLPAAHATFAVPTWTLAAQFVQQSQTPRLFLRALRAELALARAEAVDWRSVINALRPITPRIFSQWTPLQRASILKRAGSLWRLHRNRMPTHVATLIQSLESVGQLSRVCGRFIEASASSDSPVQVRVLVNANVSAKVEEEMQDYALVIDARGPNYRCQSWPLVEALITDGMLTASQTGWGLHVDLDGRAGDKIYAIGVLCYGERLETTSVPEIRQQADRIAELITACLD